MGALGNVKQQGSRGACVWHHIQGIQTLNLFSGICNPVLTSTILTSNFYDFKDYTIKIKLGIDVNLEKLSLGQD